MSNQPPTPFRNPVLDCKPEDTTRTTIVLSNRVLAAISNLHTKAGVVGITINLLLEKLVNELERNGIDQYDPGVYELCITRLAILLPVARRPDGSIAGAPGGGQSNHAAEAPHGNDGQGTGGVVNPAKGPHAGADLGVAPRKRRGKKDQQGQGTTA